MLRAPGPRFTGVQPRGLQPVPPTTAEASQWLGFRLGSEPGGARWTGGAAELLARGRLLPTSELRRAALALAEDDRIGRTQKVSVEDRSNLPPTDSIPQRAAPPLASPNDEFRLPVFPVRSRLFGNDPGTPGVNDEFTLPVFPVRSHPFGNDPGTPGVNDEFTLPVFPVRHTAQVSTAPTDAPPTALTTTQKVSVED